MGADKQVSNDLVFSEEALAEAIHSGRNLTVDGGDVRLAESLNGSGSGDTRLPFN